LSGKGSNSLYDGCVCGAFTK